MAVDKMKKKAKRKPGGGRKREIIELYYFKGMTQQEIAEELGIGRRSVGNALEGAIKKIKKIF